jgi:C4-dicarboxylate-specific signal transduction histidine kinase
VVVGLAIFLLQALTITGLLMQRRRRRAAEGEAARRGVELARAARVSIVGELSASIAHEVGQPLSAIVTNAEAAKLMLDNGVLDAVNARAIFNDVHRDALRANELIRRLRVLLEPHAVNFAPLDLNRTLEEALGLLIPEAHRRGMSLEHRFLEGSAPMLGDPIQLQQVLLNLAMNAMDAMQDTVEGERLVSVTLRPADDGFELEVADRGHGLSADARARMFEPFFTTKPHGVGVGLLTVRTIVGAHGGEVWSAARASGGSLFTVWLPRLGAAPSRGSGRMQGSPEVGGCPVRPKGNHAWPLSEKQ